MSAGGVEGDSRRSLRIAARDRAPRPRRRRGVLASPTADVGGVLALHGFTGVPHRCAASPRRWPEPACTSRCRGCPVTEPMSATCWRARWADWAGEVAAAYGRLAQRTGRIVIVGQSMGGSLALWTALHHPGSRPRADQPAHRAAAGRCPRDDRRLARRRHRDRPRHRQRHRRARGRRDRLPGTPLAPLISLLDDGLVAADRPLRRADDAAAAVHVAPGPRRRSEPERAPRQHLRRRRRPPLARTQLPRRHPGLRPPRHHRRRGRVRRAPHCVVETSGGG